MAEHFKENLVKNVGKKKGWLNERKSQLKGDSWSHLPPGCLFTFSLCPLHNLTEEETEVCIYFMIHSGIYINILRQICIYLLKISWKFIESLEWFDFSNDSKHCY